MLCDTLKFGNVRFSFHPMFAGIALRNHGWRTVINSTQETTIWERVRLFVEIQKLEIFKKQHTRTGNHGKDKR